MRLVYFPGKKLKLSVNSDPGFRARPSFLPPVTGRGQKIRVAVIKPVHKYLQVCLWISWIGEQLDFGLSMGKLSQEP
jgi:hypothetical protein